MELNFLSILFVAAVVIFLFWLFNSIYVIKEWERGVILRLGRMLPEPKGAPGNYRWTGVCLLKKN